mmetsp:Transcript_25468/g.75104  ORF Transcript_25468/g.75104 Transcript_25468/m.75104 type:complete len:307 (-) Transcript_25468:7-927(-)
MRFPSAVSAPRLRKVRGDGTFPKAKPPHANRLTCQGAGAGRGSGHLGRGALRRDGDDVAGGLVVEEVREGVSGQDGLGDKAAKGEHGQPAVCELLHLEVRLLGRVGREAERVEAVVAWLAARAAQHLVDRDCREDLEQPDPQQQLAHAALGNDGVVRLERGVVESREVPEVGEGEAKRRQHRRAAVLDLSLAQPRQGQNLGETERVEADVADEGAHRPKRLAPHQEGQRLAVHDRRRRRRARVDLLRLLRLLGGGRGGGLLHAREAQRVGVRRERQLRLGEERRHGRSHKGGRRRQRSDQHLARSR